MTTKNFVTILIFDKDYPSINLKSETHISTLQSPIHSSNQPKNQEQLHPQNHQHIQLILQNNHHLQPFALHFKNKHLIQNPLLSHLITIWTLTALSPNWKMKNYPQISPFTTNKKRKSNLPNYPNKSTSIASPFLQRQPLLRQTPLLQMIHHPPHLIPHPLNILPIHPLYLNLLHPLYLHTPSLTQINILKQSMI